MHVAPTPAIATVIMIAGVTTRWKQVIGYHLTNKSTDSAQLKPLVIEAVTHAHEIGLSVLNVTTDMGACNQAMLRAFGIHCSRELTPVNSIEHPCDSDRRLFFMADVPYLIKRLRCSFVSNEFMYISSSVVEKKSLPGNMVSLEPVCQLLVVQETRDLRIAPSLSHDVITPNTWETMNVGHVSSGLRFLVDQF